MRCRALLLALLVLPSCQRSDRASGTEDTTSQASPAAPVTTDTSAQAGAPAAGPGDSGIATSPPDSVLRDSTASH